MPTYTIWIADDDSSIQEVLTIILMDEGYTVRTFNSAMELYENISDNLPDLFILDGLMGGMDGLETCVKLKNDSRTCHIPVIMLSGMDDFKTKALAHCADAAIEKPFQLADLLAQVAELLKKDNIVF
jgi:DNA-binding response OmpR family regulator